MIMKNPAQERHYELRWPVALAILVVIGLLAVLPGQIRLFPIWVVYIGGGTVLVSIAAVGLTAGKKPWLRVEHTVMLIFVVVTEGSTLANLVKVIQMMVDRSAQLSGTQLLSSSIAIWVVNLVTFSLLYWQVDRGGPEARVNHTSPRPDWLFPQEGAPSGDVSPGWHPKFVDYLYLGYSTATAFSTTEVMPLTPRAKMLMMLESAISLTTIVVTASRAINILGS